MSVASISANSPVKVVAVTGGKGGVGKTSIALNLSLALGELQRRVLLMDADLGLASIDLLLGLQARHNLGDVLDGNCSLRDVLLPGPGGIRLVPAASGVQKMTALSAREHAGLIHAFSEMNDQLDLLVIDTAPGISEMVISFVRAAQEVVLVVCDEPSSIADAHALIKLLNRKHQIFRFHMIASMTHGAGEGEALLDKLRAFCEQSLDVSIQYLGNIPFDDNMRRSAQHRQALLDYAPGTKAALSVRAIAEKVDAWPVQSGASGRLEFFIERLLLTASA